MLCRKQGNQTPKATTTLRSARCPRPKRDACVCACDVCVCGDGGKRPSNLLASFINNVACLTSSPPLEHTTLRPFSHLHSQPHTLNSHATTTTDSSSSSPRAWGPGRPLLLPRPPSCRNGRLPPPPPPQAAAAATTPCHSPPTIPKTSAAPPTTSSCRP